jgi:hypothetical protein
MIKCPFCQFENEDGALFCDHCKSDLGATASAPAASSSTPYLAPAVAEAIPLSFPPSPESAAPLVAVMVEDAGAAPPAEPINANPAPGPDIGTTSPDAIAPSPPPVAETPQPPAEAPVAEAAKFAPGTRPKLVVLRGLRLNIEYPLYEGENYVGRADEKAVDIDLEDQEAPERIWSSRQHALITFEDGSLAIEDLNSTNGTFVNRNRIHPGQKRPLQVNDVVMIGTVQMRVIV